MPSFSPQSFTAAAENENYELARLLRERKELNLSLGPVPTPDNLEYDLTLSPEGHHHRNAIDGLISTRNFLWMFLVNIVLFASICAERSASNEDVPIKLLLSFQGLSMGIFLALLLCRFVWRDLCLKRVFFERGRTISYISYTMDSAIWFLCYALCRYTIWEETSYKTSNSDIKFTWITFPDARISAPSFRLISSFNLIFLLWGAGNLVVEGVSASLDMKAAVTLRLDLRRFLVRYSILRRLSHHISRKYRERFDIPHQVSWGDGLRRRLKREKAADRDVGDSEVKIAAETYEDLDPLLPPQLRRKEISQLNDSVFLTASTMLWMSHNPVRLHSDGRLIPINDVDGAKALGEEIFDYAIATYYLGMDSPQCCLTAAPDLGSSEYTPHHTEGEELDRKHSFQSPSAYVQPSDACRSIRRDFFSTILNARDNSEFLKFAEVSETDQGVTKKHFGKSVVSVYKDGRGIKNLLQSQKSVRKILRRITQVVTYALCTGIFFYVGGVSLLSLAVSFSAIVGGTVAVLGSLYSTFISSLLWVIMLNPYRVGDRCRVNGSVMYVIAISPYCTTFCSDDCKMVYISNETLRGTLFFNEDRLKWGHTMIEIDIAFMTTQQQLEQLNRELKKSLAQRSDIFFQNFLITYVSSVQPSNYIKYTLWIRHRKGAYKWGEIRLDQTVWYFIVLKAVRKVGISYKLPPQRWEHVNNSPPTT